jgi:hypothetical protein
MSTDETSNRRCRWLLDQRGFRYWQEDEIGQVLTLQGTRPDFLVETPVPIRFLLELKSFEQDTLLDRIDPSITTFSLDPMSLQKRANRLVRDAAAQLRPYAATGLPMLVMLDNYRQKGISLDEHTLGGLFGDLQIHFQVDPTTGRGVDGGWVRAEEGSPLAGGLNRHVSAVAVLIPVTRFDTLSQDDDFSVERPMKIRIVYNDGATVPFPRDVFNSSDDEHMN